MARPRLPALVRVSTSRSGGLYTRTYAEFPQEELRDYGSPGSARAIAEAFQVDIVQGLIHLVFEQLGERLPAPLSFLREFAKAMFIQWLLAARAGARSLALPAPHATDAWEQLARNVPDITTANATVLDELWRELHRQVVAILKANNLTLLEWICLKGGDVWRRIGDLVLRLDVGGDDPGRPFVLYCHVIDGLSSSERLRLTPVYVHVLGNGRVAGFGGRIYKLLREAAERSPIVARLLASQEIFSPCHLIPRDAHAFLLSIPALEAIGLSVQVPDWWKTRRAPQLAVRTRIGSRAPTPLGVETLLDVSTAYLVDERELSEAEWRQLIQKSVDGLVNVAGRWVEVNREQIDHAEQDWRTTQQMRARGGATVSEVGSSRVDLQACKLEYSIVSPK